MSEIMTLPLPVTETMSSLSAALRALPGMISPNVRRGVSSNVESTRTDVPILMRSLGVHFDSILKNKTALRP